MMTRNTLLANVVRTHAVIAIFMAPLLVFGSWFVARSVLELFFAFGQLLMIVPFWRMFHLRRWAGDLVCLVGWASFAFFLAHEEDFDLIGAKLTIAAVVVIPTLALTWGKRIWQRGF